MSFSRRSAAAAAVDDGRISWQTSVTVGNGRSMCVVGGVWRGGVRESVFLREPAIKVPTTNNWTLGSQSRTVAVLVGSTASVPSLSFRIKNWDCTEKVTDYYSSLLIP